MHCRVSKKEVAKELREHPWASKKTAKRIALDHSRSKRKYYCEQKTTTRNGKREYQRNLMRVRLGISKDRFGILGRKPKRILLKSFLQDLKKVKP